MTIFDRREEAFEAAVAHAKEAEFKERARALRGLALWAAERMGKTPQAASAYVDGIVGAMIRDRDGEQAALDGIAADLEASGHFDGRRKIGRRFEELLADGQAPGRPA